MNDGKIQRFAEIGLQNFTNLSKITFAGYYIRDPENELAFERFIEQLPQCKGRLREVNLVNVNFSKNSLFKKLMQTWAALT